MSDRHDVSGEGPRFDGLRARETCAFPATKPAAGFPEAVHEAGAAARPSITLAEVLYGIERLPDGRRKDLLSTTAAEVFSAFADQLLAFDAAAASEYAELVNSRERSGAPIDGFDAQIAAICRVHGATLATRNVTDFRDTGIEVTDPWHDGG